MAKVIKAEMWDRMQYLFRNYYDRMVHVKLNYDGHFDIASLKSAIIFMIEKAPVLHSSFNSSVAEPYWREEKYSIDDILSVEKVEYIDKSADEWLLGVIPYTNNVQMKIAVFENETSSVLALRVNHMCMDGGDLKYFLTTLCANYNAIKSRNFSALQMKEGSRSFDQVYSKLEGEDLKKARNLYKNVSKTEDKVSFPWSESKDTDSNQIVRRVIDEEKFLKMKAVSKKLGITINDAIMAMVFRSLYELCGLKDDDSVTVSCAIDLRKHIVEGGAHGGLTNHTAWMACRTLNKGESMRDTVVNVIRSTKSYKRDKFMGLYSLPLLKLAYTILPPDIAEFAIKIGYTNPLIAVSNIGLLDANKLTFDGLTITDGFMSGAVKYKPFFLMSLTTLLNRVTLSTAIRGGEEDIAIANKFFDLMMCNLDEFIVL